MKNLLLIVLVMISLNACKSLVPFTEDLKNSNSWNKEDLKKIQYYNSEPIILYRQIKSNETGIVSGKIKMVDGKQVEEIVIKKGTPGVITEMPDGNRFAVSFEIGDDHFLTFGVDPKRGGRYYLRLKNYEKNKYALVTYNAKVYNINPVALNSYLEVNLKKIDKEQTNLRVAKGRKL